MFNLCRFCTTIENMHYYMKGKSMSKNKSNKKFWERVAKLYTPMHEKKNKELYEKLCEKIGKMLTRDMSVLELACGTGQLSFSLCEKVSVWEATDFSEKMIIEAEKRKKDFLVNFSVQDATNLPYNDGAFDTVVIANALHIMPDPDKALSEIKRVLKKDGILIAPTFVYDGHINKMRIWMMERIGFKTFHKWKSSELTEYVRERGFVVKESSVIEGEMLPECLLVCKR